MLSKTTALLGAMCAAVAHAASVPALYPHVPVVFWSERKAFHAQNSYVDAVLDEQELVSVLNTVIARDATRDAHNVMSSDAVKTAEALCVFVRKSLRSDQLADFGKASFVQSAVKSSASSVVIPHTTRTKSLSKALADGKPTIISVENVDAWIKSDAGKKLLSNGKADLLVVEVPEQDTLVASDAKIKKAATALSEATSGLADFALTGDEAEPVIVKDPYSRRRLATSTAPTTTQIICDAGYLIGMSSTGKAFCFSHYVHMTPEVLTALIFGFFFLFLAYVGLSVLHAIQTPLRYPHHGPPKGKEF